MALKKLKPLQQTPDQSGRLDFSEFNLRTHYNWDVELFSWKTTSHKDHLEVGLPNSRLLSSLIGMWSYMKITLCFFLIIIIFSQFKRQVASNWGLDFLQSLHFYAIPASSYFMVSDSQCVRWSQLAWNHENTLKLSFTILPLHINYDD